ncbi:MAG: EAL domain-containing protein [Dokdonella sp.]|uniref:GGDEF domain-containing response regulator n=2 Tax=Dokdonella sp. TaxID=2291710 RepID=UPI001B43AE02|nr:GGDEF domain-containing response regulator [Dokdonella sp.]MBK8123786.1 EAL domain-containing protein [Dokdonella sp.]MBP6330401.1 EAL domain-containing protein [Dokdonella sp.]HNV09552.1 EAL domain-containing protein [Dokdonella sp.]
MSGILIVERSTTLNHLLRRTLAAAELPVRAEIGNYLEACDHLRRLGNPASNALPYALAVIGAPARMTREFRALLEYTRDAADAPATLLMAHEETAEIRAWNAATLRGQVLLWSQFSRIPASVRELAPEEIGLDAAPADAADRIRILFVDDSKSVCQAYSDMLERQGYRVDVAASIEEAERLVESCDYDMAIVDYFLPDGSGDELCRKLCQRNPAPLVAVITGTYREDIIRRCLQAGASECMFKNEARDLFLTRVRTLARTIEMRKTADLGREQLDGILGSVGDGVLGVDGEGRISFINPTGLRMLGYADEDDLLGLLAQATVHPQENPRSSPLVRAYRDGIPMHRVETMFRRRDGSGVPVEYAVLPLSSHRQTQGAVVVFRDIAERRTAERLRWELSHDPLTGLPNTRHLRQRLIAELTRLRERGGYSALLQVELDREEDQDPPRGDELLRTVAHALAHRLREGDVLARGEGDAFLLLLTQVQVDNIDVLRSSFQQLLDGREYTVGGNSRTVKARIGAELLTPGALTADEVLERARAAARGKNPDEPGDAGPVGEQTLVTPINNPSERLRLALEQARFVMLVQPVVALANLPEGSAPVAEDFGWRFDQLRHDPLFAVQLRMVGKDGQLIQPRAFIPLAERVGMVQRIDLWVIHGLLNHLATSGAARARVGLIARLSPATVADPEVLAEIEKAIVDTGVAASCLLFEINDSPELSNLPAALHFIARLRAMGCRFIINGSDAEAGLLPFLHAQHQPGNMVRVDRSIVQDIVNDERNLDKITAIAQLATSLQMRVVAGEVDNDATLLALRGAGVDYLQGGRLGQARLIKRVDFSALRTQA